MLGTAQEKGANAIFGTEALESFDAATGFLSGTAIVLPQIFS